MDNDALGLRRAVEQYEEEFIRQTAGLWVRHGPLTQAEYHAWRICYVNHVHLNADSGDDDGS